MSGGFFTLVWNELTPEKEIISLESHTHTLFSFHILASSKVSVYLPSFVNVGDQIRLSRRRGDPFQPLYHHPLNLLNQYAGPETNTTFAQRQRNQGVVEDEGDSSPPQPLSPHLVPLLSLRPMSPLICLCLDPTRERGGQAWESTHQRRKRESGLEKHFYSRGGKSLEESEEEGTNCCIAGNLVAIPRKGWSEERIIGNASSFHHWLKSYYFKRNLTWACLLICACPFHSHTYLSLIPPPLTVYSHILL